MARWGASPRHNRPLSGVLGHTDADRKRIKAGAAKELLEYELDGDRTDPTWLRYCERHGLDPKTEGN